MSVEDILQSIEIDEQTLYEHAEALDLEMTEDQVRSVALILADDESLLGANREAINKAFEFLEI